MGFASDALLCLEFRLGWVEITEIREDFNLQFDESSQLLWNRPTSLLANN